MVTRAKRKMERAEAATDRGVAGVIGFLTRVKDSPYTAAIIFVAFIAAAVVAAAIISGLGD